MHYFKLFIFLLFSALVYTNTNPDSLNKDAFDYEDNRIDASVIHLDYIPLFKSSFLFNKYVPNNMDDFRVHGLILDGSYNTPLYQMIPEKLYFDIRKEGTFSQLTYKHKKSEGLYNTKVGLKTDLKKDVIFVGLFESKSFVNNINQNHLINVQKRDKNENIEFSFMYHIDDANIEYLDPTATYNEDVDYFSNFKSFIRYNESFHFGGSYNYKDDNYILNHHTSFQVSDSKVSSAEDEYESRVHWNQNHFKYNLSDLVSIYVDYNYKSILREVKYSDDDIVFDDNFSTSSLGLEFTFINNLSLAFAGDYLYYNDRTPHNPNNDIYSIKNDFSYSINYFNDNIRFSLINKNDIISILELDQLLFTYINKKSFKMSYHAGRYHQLFEVGEIKFDFNKNRGYVPSYFNYFSKEYESYWFGLIESKLQLNWFSFKINYRHYQNEILFFDNIATFEVMVSPKLKNKRYRPYGKIIGHHLSINRPYDMDLRYVDIFRFDENDINIKKRIVNGLNLELGVLFDSFKITYVLTNPLNSPINSEQHYGDYLIPIEGRFSYIDLIWIFQD